MFCTIQVKPFFAAKQSPFQKKKPPDCRLDYYKLMVVVLRHALFIWRRTSTVRPLACFVKRLSVASERESKDGHRHHAASRTIPPGTWAGRREDARYHG